MSMFSQAFSIIIYHGISSLGHGREVLDGINTIYKMVLFQLISTVQMTVAKGYDTYMIMHTVTRTYDVSLAR